jgi:C-terminal processing protease CtpA/Prc
MRLALIAVALTCALPAHAAGLDTDQRRAAVAGLADNVRARYVFPEVAAHAADALLARLAAGSYGQTRPEPLAEALTSDLRALTGDRQLQVRFEPDFDTPAAAPTADRRERERRSFAADNFGVRKVEVLPGNVGLLDLRFFAPEELAAPILANAMSLLASSDALIVDLRDNGGGDADTIAFLCTYFFPEGRRVHLSDLRDRLQEQARESWIRAVVPGARYLDRPLYLLTSASTFGGGEELAYDLQALERGTVVGERTGGDAGTGASVAVGGGLVAFIPTARAVSAVTGSSWHGDGVKPDLATPAAKALEAAHAAAVAAILQAEHDPDRRRSLQHTLALLKPARRTLRRLTR